MDIVIDMDMDIDQWFDDGEIDMKYELDAPRWFDFTRDESPAEGHEAELWFETAKGYSSSESENRSSSGCGESELCLQSSKSSYQSGLGCTSQRQSTKQTGKIKSAVKSNFHRSSTLMKPTASQLAKQKTYSRYQPLPPSTVIDNQASKRQKLERGIHHKVGYTMQQTNFIHKSTKKDGAVAKKYSTCARIKPNISIEPNVITAHRPQRTRSTNMTVLKHEPPTTHSFKARPLNRKILEAPSLPLLKKSTPKLPEFSEFRLKTLERAKQHSSATSSNAHNKVSQKSEKPSTFKVANAGNRETHRPRVADSNQDESGMKYNYEVGSLHTKLLSSKRDISTSHFNKQYATVPMEVNPRAGKKVQLHLPIEHFSKLSLSSELKPNNGSQSKLPPRVCVSMKYKGSKENRWDSSQAGHEAMHILKEKPHSFRRSNGCPEVAVQSATKRSLGSRPIH